MTVSISSNVYISTVLGPHVGNFLVTEVTIDGPYVYAPETKQVIFVVDTSGSMCATLPMVKKSLLAFYNCLMDIGAGFTPPQITVITFSDHAKKIYPIVSAAGATVPSFADCIREITDEYQTNLGEGMEMALQELDNMRIVNATGATWIVVLTDGIPNQGSCQTAESMVALKNRIPTNTKIVTLGFGENFSVEICSALGEFTYLENEEAIPKLMGSLAAEVLSSFALDAKIDIIPKELLHGRTDLVGSCFLGSVYPGRTFCWAFKMDDAVTPSYFVGANGVLQWDTNPNTRSLSSSGSTCFIIGQKSTLSSEIKTSYYEASAGRILLGIYERYKEGILGKYAKGYRNKVQKWSDAEANESRENVLRILSCLQHERGGHCAAYAAYSASQSAASQSSYLEASLMSPLQVSFAHRISNEVTGQSRKDPSVLSSHLTSAPLSQTDSNVPLPSPFDRSITPDLLTMLKSRRK